MRRDRSAAEGGALMSAVTGGVRRDDAQRERAVRIVLDGIGASR